MVIGAYLPYQLVVSYLNYAIWLFALGLELVAFIHCLIQRSDGFPAIGTLPKGAWLAIIGISGALTYVFGANTAPGIIAMIGIAAAAIYLLDVRAGLRDLSDGKGFW